jgi:hypothetical protein
VCILGAKGDEIRFRIFYPSVNEILPRCAKPVWESVKS